MRSTLGVVAAVLFAGSTAAAQVTTGSNSSGAPISYWGKPNTQTYGQTFFAPNAGNTQLDEFSFWMNNANALTFRAYVYAWNGSMATGSAVFASGPMSVIAGGNASGAFTKYSASTGGVGLTFGQQYVAFFSTTGESGNGYNQWDSGANNGDGNLSTGFVFINNGENSAAWTSNSWSQCWQGCGSDVRHELVFNRAQDPGVVPEPASVVLMASGLLGVGVAARRRRNKK